MGVLITLKELKYDSTQHKQIMCEIIIDITNNRSMNDTSYRLIKCETIQSVFKEVNNNKFIKILTLENEIEILNTDQILSIIDSSTGKSL